MGMFLNRTCSKSCFREKCIFKLSTMMIQCFLDTTSLNTAFFLLLSAFLPTPVFFLLYLCKLILNRTYILQRIPCYNVHFRGHQSVFSSIFNLDTTFIRKMGKFDQTKCCQYDDYNCTSI